MRFLLAIFGILALSTPVMTQSAKAEGSGSKCVRTFALREFQPIDDYHVLIKGRTNSELYLVTMRRACRDIDFSTRLTTSFENKRTCPPFVQFIKSEDDICPVRWIQYVDSRDEAFALAAKDMDARAKVKAEKKAKKQAKKNSDS